MNNRTIFAQPNHPKNKTLRSHIIAAIQESITASNTKHSFNDNIQSLKHIIEYSTRNDCTAECTAECTALIIKHLGKQLSCLPKKLLNNMLNHNNLMNKIRSSAVHFSPQELTDVLWVLAKLGITWNSLEKHRVSANLIHAISYQLNKFDVEQNITVLWVLARFNRLTHHTEREIEQETLLKNIFSYLNNPDNKTAPDIPTLFWSAAILNIPYTKLKNSGLLSLILASIENNVSKYTGKELIKILKAFVLYNQTVHDMDEHLLQAILIRIGKINLEKRTIVNLVWEMAKLGLTSDFLQQIGAINILALIKKSLLQVAGELSLENNARILWSLAVLSNKNEEMDDLARQLWNIIPFEKIGQHHRRSCISKELAEASEYLSLNLPEHVKQLLKNQPQPTSSQFHKNVVAVLTPILESLHAKDIKQEVCEGAFFLDLVATLNGKKIDFEFNGPCHYDDHYNDYPHYRLREMLLKQKGYTIIPIPKHVWVNETDKTAYLTHLIEHYAPKPEVNTQIEPAHFYSGDSNKVFSFWHAATNNSKAIQHTNETKAENAYCVIV